MTDGVIPEEVKQFLLKNIDSIAQWEGLLLLLAEPQKTWDLKSIAQRLYITERETLSWFSQLVGRGMITPMNKNHCFTLCPTEWTCGRNEGLRFCRHPELSAIPICWTLGAGTAGRRSGYVCGASASPPDRRKR